MVSDSGEPGGNDTQAFSNIGDHFDLLDQEQGENLGEELRLAGPTLEDQLWDARIEWPKVNITRQFHIRF